MTHLGVDLALADGQWQREFGDAIAYDLMGGAGQNLPVVERVACLPGGMASGAPAFELAIRLPDGRVVFAETSWRLMRNAVRGLEARWPLDNDGPF